MGDDTYLSYPKEVHKSDLQSPSEPHNEDENKATLLGCEAKILVEEQATIVSIQEDGNVKNMDNNSSNFCRSHLHLQPSDPCKYKKSSLASEDYKRKTTCEGDKFTPSFPVGDHTTSEKKGDIVNGNNMVKEYFGSDPKEQEISYLNSSFEFPNEVEDNPPPDRCELGNLKEKNMVQRDAHSFEFWTLLQHDEVVST